MGSWVVVERFTNRKTCRVQNLEFAQNLQVTREQIKVIDVPSAWKKETEPMLQTLLRLLHVETGIGVRVRKEPENVDIP